MVAACLSHLFKRAARAPFAKGDDMNDILHAALSLHEMNREIERAACDSYLQNPPRPSHALSLFQSVRLTNQYTPELLNLLLSCVPSALEKFQVTEVHNVLSTIHHFRHYEGTREIVMQLARRANELLHERKLTLSEIESLDSPDGRRYAEILRFLCSIEPPINQAKLQNFSNSIFVEFHDEMDNQAKLTLLYSFAKLGHGDENPKVRHILGYFLHGGMLWENVNVKECIQMGFILHTYQTSVFTEHWASWLQQMQRQQSIIKDSEILACLLWVPISVWSDADVFVLLHDLLRRIIERNITRTFRETSQLFFLEMTFNCSNGVTPDALALADRIATHESSGSPQDALQIVSTLSKARNAASRFSAEFYLSLRSRLSQHSESYKPEKICQVIDILSSVQCLDNKLVGRFATLLETKVDLLPVEHTVHLLFSLLPYPSVSEIRKMGPVLVRHATSFLRKDNELQYALKQNLLRNIMCFYATMEVSDQGVFHLVRDEVYSMLAQFSAVTLVDLISSYSQIAPTDDVTKRLIYKLANVYTRVPKRRKTLVRLFNSLAAVDDVEHIELCYSVLKDLVKSKEPWKSPRKIACVFRAANRLHLYHSKIFNALWEQLLSEMTLLAKSNSFSRQDVECVMYALNAFKEGNLTLKSNSGLECFLEELLTCRKTAINRIGLPHIARFITLLGDTLECKLSLNISQLIIKFLKAYLHSFTVVELVRALHTLCNTLSYAKGYDSELNNVIAKELMKKIARSLNAEECVSLLGDTMELNMVCSNLQKIIWRSLEMNCESLKSQRELLFLIRYVAQHSLTLYKENFSSFLEAIFLRSVRQLGKVRDLTVSGIKQVIANGISYIRDQPDSEEKVREACLSVIDSYMQNRPQVKHNLKTSDDELAELVHAKAEISKLAITGNAQTMYTA